jgi:hypothetical protein
MIDTTIISGVLSAVIMVLIIYVFVNHAYIFEKFKDWEVRRR